MSQRGKKQPTPFRKLLNNGSAHNEPFKVMKVRHPVFLSVVRPSCKAFLGVLHTDGEYKSHDVEDQVVCRYNTGIRGH
jgi:hypothetical protein